jgi:hypothetical protein
MANFTYGELADGAASVSEQSGVQAEICRDHLFDPSSLRVRLPLGYRVMAATELASQDENLAALIKRDPRYGSYAFGSLCFVLADSFLVDGVRAHGRSPIPMAFWWARIAPTDSVKTDPRMKGRVSWVQLGSWYSSSGTDQARIRRNDPMATFVELRVEEVGKDLWRMELALPDGTVRADVRVNGPRVVRKATGPGFMTVLFSGENVEEFTVYTYFGHHHRDAAGVWSATGGHALNEAFRIDGETEVFKTLFQDGWQARAGLYRHR